MALGHYSRFFIFTLICQAFTQWQKADGQTLDQLIQSSMQTSHSGDFMQDSGDVLVELDMLFKPEDWLEIQRAIDEDSSIERVVTTRRNSRRRSSMRREKRKATRPLAHRWSNKVIPYTLARGTFSSSDSAQIQAAMNDWEKYTCLNFRRRRSSDRNYIAIQNGGGCSSYVGMVGGSQAVSLAPGCRVKGVIIHELGHAIGFQHEQTRPDRNQHVRINYGNIQRGTEFNFQQYSSSVVNDYGVPYDYTSVMHYGQYAFSINGRPTIQTIDPAKQNLIGNRYGHSFRDIKLANLMYNCADSCGSKTCPGEGFVGKDCKCYCPGSPIKLCNGNGGGDGGDGGDSGEEEGKCSDQHVNCGSWAAQGECTANPGYMLQSCQESCNSCDDDGGDGGKECVDSEQHCEYWAGSGYCDSQSYRQYMVDNCAKSCNKCGGSGGNGGGKRCEDDNDSCAYWASAGECAANPAYMLVNCKKSCRQC